MEQLIANLTPNGLKIRIEEALKKDSSLVTESGELNYTKIRDMAQKLDPHLAELLMTEESCVTAFFKKIGKSKNYIFDSKRFADFLDFNTSNNSYSKFLGKKIGLYYGDELLTDRGEVVLNFPYKDCVLEGGQKTEDGEDVVFTKDSKTGEIKESTEKRREIFYNEILAADEITSLFEPKAFCNVKRYEMPKQVRHDSHSAETRHSGEISHPDEACHPELVSGSICTHFNRDKAGMITDNLIIKGNNLLALHSLYKEFAGRVKLIYIDPPYNTGSDSFAYNDNYNHSTWLTFMKNRLEIARELLREDGCIFVQIDNSPSTLRESPEFGYLQVLIDEVFKRKNYVTVLTWRKKGNASNTADGIGTITESIFMYAKNIEQVDINLLEFKRSYKYEENGNAYNLEYPVKTNDGAYERKTMQFPIKVDGKTFLPPEGKRWTLGEDSIKEIIKNKKYKIEDGKFKIKKFRDDYLKGDAKLYNNLLLEQGSLKTAKTQLTDLGFPKEIFDTPKPEELMQQILELSTSEGDLVLDYHLGSGTTAAVAHKMHRQYIGVEQMDYIKTVSVERLKKVIEGEQGGISKSVGWNPQNAEEAGSFVYLELAAFNETALKEISACKNYEELCALFKPLCQKYFLYYNVHIKDFGEKIISDESFKTLPLKKQKEMFCHMLDLNELYINKSEMEDAQFGLSEKDIAATKDFYGEK